MGTAAVYLNHISSSSSSSSSSPVSLDFAADGDAALYCEEEDDGIWDEEDSTPPLKPTDGMSRNQSPASSPPSPSPDHPLLPEQTLFFSENNDDDQLLLLSLLSKEKDEHQIHNHLHDLSSSPSSVLATPRAEAVDWILTVNTHYAFSNLTAILAVTYLDKFLSSTTHPDSSLLFPPNYIDLDNKPWLIQLLAVTCLSLAAKVEETHVPLLLDLQVVETASTKYLFEAKTIQKMEVLVLSTLNWKMNAVTPISFLDHLFVNSSSGAAHLRRCCERLLLSLLPDWRFVKYLPSVLAAATMMLVLDQVVVEPSSRVHDYKHRILGLLHISEEDVKDCYDLIIHVSSSSPIEIQSNPHKRRKYSHGYESPPSPNGVIDACYRSDSSSSGDSWRFSNG